MPTDTLQSLQNGEDTVATVRTCYHCGARFRAKTSRRKFCDDKCRFLAWKGQHLSIPKTAIDSVALETGLPDLLDRLIHASGSHE